MIAAIILAAVREVAIDAGLALLALCATSVLGACLWAFLFRRRRAHHKNTRGYL
jgi:hypothetical protein